jgi:hypothetical protein
MTALVQIYTGNHPKDLVQAVLALQSACAVSPATPAEAAANGNPAIPAQTANRGAGLWKDSFQLQSTGAAQTKIKAELPYSPKQFAASESLRASILPIPGAGVAVFNGPASTTPAPDSPENLEQYAYDCAKRAGALISFGTANGLAKIMIEITIEQSIEDLLAVASGGGY